MKKYYYIFIGFFLFICMQMGANPTISFFFRPLSDLEKIVSKLKKPGHVVKAQVHGAMDHSSVMGILVLYAGYMATSDFNGEIIMPRKHSSSSVNIVVMSELLPVMLFENTVDHWQFIPGVPAVMYSAEQKYDDTTGYYWELKQIPIPADYKIPLSSIIIVAKPKNIVIPSGITPTHETANLVLPPIYVTKGINIVTNNIYMLTLRHLFKPVDVKNKRELIQILTHVID